MFIMIMSNLVKKSSNDEDSQDSGGMMLGMIDYSKKKDGRSRYANMICPMIPSGKRLQKTNCKIAMLFEHGPFSIANCNKLPSGKLT